MSNCLQPDELRLFLQGQLPATDSVRVEQHLASCPRCLGTIETICSSDPLLKAIQAQVHSNAQPEKEVVQRLIAKAKNLNVLQDASAVDTTSLKAAASGGSTLPTTFDGSMRRGMASPVQGTVPEYIARYRVEKLLGKGGFGAVYLAFDEPLGRQVAVKVPHRRLVEEPAAASLYLVEAQSPIHFLRCPK